MGESEIILALGCAFGTYIFYYLLLIYRNQRQIQQHGQTTEATIVALVPIYDPEYPTDMNHCRYEPIIRFQTLTGAIVVARYTHNTFSEWEVGQHLIVRYLSANPQEFLLPSHWDSREDWLFTGMMLGAGTVVISILAYVS